MLKDDTYFGRKNQMSDYGNRDQKRYFEMDRSEVQERKISSRIKREAGYNDSREDHEYHRRLKRRSGSVERKESERKKRKYENSNSRRDDKYQEKYKLSDINRDIKRSNEVSRKSGND